MERPYEDDGMGIDSFTADVVPMGIRTINGQPIDGLG